MQQSHLGFRWGFPVFNPDTGHGRYEFKHGLIYHSEGIQGLGVFPLYPTIYNDMDFRRRN